MCYSPWDLQLLHFYIFCSTNRKWGIWHAKHGRIIMKFQTQKLVQILILKYVPDRTNRGDRDMASAPSTLFAALNRIAFASKQLKTYIFSHLRVMFFLFTLSAGSIATTRKASLSTCRWWRPWSSSSSSVWCSSPRRGTQRRNTKRRSLSAWLAYVTTPIQVQF